MAAAGGRDEWVRARYLGHLRFPFFLCGSDLELLTIGMSGDLPAGWPAHGEDVRYGGFPMNV
jgi:hypothetical protein